MWEELNIIMLYLKSSESKHSKFKEIQTNPIHSYLKQRLPWNS